MIDEKLESLYKSVYAKPNETLYEHTSELLSQCNILKECGYLNNKDLLEVCCIYHDLGKINPAFQERIKTGKYFDYKKEIGHNILSAYLVNIYIDLNREEKEIVISSILNHHNYVANFDVIVNQTNLIKENLISINEKYFKYNEEDFNNRVVKSIRGRFSNRLKAIRENNKYILVKGLLHKCDYSASAHIDCEFENKFLIDCMNELGYEWREIQRYCLENSDENIVITGSTGLGKTEASLLWAGDNKIFYVLPLRTAINAMYSRIKDKIIGEEFYDKLGLLHGETANVYLADKKHNKNESLNSKKFYEYYYRTKNMSLPITVTTPDQLFDFVFKYPSYELKLATFSYSKIIIDEIQAYSPDILAYTIYAIKRINTLGGKFAVFTATLAPFVRDLLLEQIDEEADIEFKEAVFLTEKNRHNMKIVEERISAEYLWNTIENFDDINTCLIVMNTVKEAQNLYSDLQALIKEGKLEDKIELNLLHARFTVKDRADKEKLIFEDGQKTTIYDDMNLKTKKLKIWVSTQVVEASLDIDFDVLFTELSELLSLFQRFGRCYRAREKTGKEPNVYVFTTIDDKYLTGSTYGFIDRGLHMLSKEALLEKGDGIITEKEKVDMINEYFTIKKLRSRRDSNYLDEYREKYRYIKNLNIEEIDYLEANKKFRNIVSYKAIPELLFTKDEGIAKLRDEIEELEMLIENTELDSDKNDLRLKLIEQKNELNNYTLNVNISFISGADKIEIGGEQILIIKYKYNNELGLTREKSSESIII